jgi:hypothetical protein
MSMLIAGPLDSVCVEALINSEWTIASTTDNVIHNLKTRFRR